MTMEDLLTGDDQRARWNGHAGRTWVARQESLDRLFQPVEDDLLAHVVARSPGAVLDIGCGTGATTLGAARALGSAAHCVGLDISESMIAHAHRRAEAAMLGVEFIFGDAATHPFERASFDFVMSRFGVMFFPNPVNAFKNIRASTRAGAELHFYCWRSPAENPFMTAADRAAGPLLPPTPTKPTNAPGQFALADSRYVQRILEQSGWSDVEIARADYEMTLPVEELEDYYTRMGAVGSLLPSLDADLRSRIVDAMRPEFEKFVCGDQVKFNAACWHVAAVAD